MEALTGHVKHGVNATQAVYDWFNVQDKAQGIDRWSIADDPDRPIDDFSYAAAFSARGTRVERRAPLSLARRLDGTGIPSTGNEPARRTLRWMAGGAADAFALSPADR